MYQTDLVTQNTFSGKHLCHSFSDGVQGINEWVISLFCRSLQMNYWINILVHKRIVIVPECKQFHKWLEVNMRKIVQIIGNLHDFREYLELNGIQIPNTDNRPFLFTSTLWLSHLIIILVCSIGSITDIDVQTQNCV